MRKISTLLCFAFFVASIQAQTTLEEYNYVTKGYKIQVESGLDMKKGYVLKDLFELPLSELEKRARGAKNGVIQTPPPAATNSPNKRPEQKLSGKGLYRTGQAVPCAIMILVSRGSEIQKTMCIPHEDSEDIIWGMYYQALKGDPESTLLMAAAAAHCAAYFAKN